MAAQTYRIDCQTVPSAQWLLGCLCAWIALNCFPGCGPNHGALTVVRHSTAVGPTEQDGLEAPARIRDAIQQATDYLVARQQTDGRFCEQSEDAPAEPYNWTRHARIVVTLVRSYREQGGEHVLAAARRGIKTLGDQAIRPIAIAPDALAVWTTVAQNDGELVTAATAESAASAIQAFSALPAETGTPAPIAQLGRFLLAMQRADGRFTSAVSARPSTSVDTGDDATHLVVSGPTMANPSSAARALLTLHQVDRRDRWLTAATSCLLQLAESRRGKLDAPFDPDGIIATAQLFQLDRLNLLTPDQANLQDQVRQLVRQIHKERPKDAANTGLRGALTRSGRTDQTALRASALAASLYLIPESDGALRQQSIDALSEAIQLLVAVQIPSGDASGGLPWAIGVIHPEITEAAEAQNRVALEIRINTVQLALNAWLDWNNRPDEPLTIQRSIQVQQQ